jgi:hypothetical protein
MAATGALNRRNSVSDAGGFQSQTRDEKARKIRPQNAVFPSPLSQTGIEAMKDNDENACEKPVLLRSRHVKGRRA